MQCLWGRSRVPPAVMMWGSPSRFLTGHHWMVLLICISTTQYRDWAGPAVQREIYQWPWFWINIPLHPKHAQMGLLSCAAVWAWGYALWELLQEGGWAAPKKSVLRGQNAEMESFSQCSITPFHCYFRLWSPRFLLLFLSLECSLCSSPGWQSVDFLFWFCQFFRSP